MKNKYLIILFLAVLLVGCHSREVGFVYKPVNPRAGQTITFTNSSEIGSTWSWNFGDGTSSTVKSPTKTYTSAGSYLVTLVVDDRKSLTYSATIVVGDTMPSIVLADTATSIFSPIECSISCYNPNNDKISYQWLLTDDAVLVDGLLTDSVVNLYFTQPNDSALIGAIITIGSQTDSIYTTIHISDTTAHSLVINSTNRQLFKQRIFTPQLGDINSLDENIKSNHIEVYGDDVFSFTDDGIYRFSTDDKKRVVASEQPVIAGTILHDTLFFKSTNDVLYGVAIANLTEQVVPSVADIAFNRGGQEPNVMSALYVSHDGTNLLFAGDGITVGNQNYDISSVQAAVVDKINGKIYAVDASEHQLVVFNYGADIVEPTAIAEADANSLAIDYSFDRIYYANKDTLFYLPLIHSRQNTKVGESVRLASDVQSFTLDTKLRYIK